MIASSAFMISANHLDQLEKTSISRSLRDKWFRSLTDSISTVSSIQSTRSNSVTQFQVQPTRYPDVLSTESSTIHGSFSRLLASRPDTIHKTAVIYGDRVLTFGQLDRLSDFAMKLMHDKNLARNSLVIAISMEPSIEMIAILLGILKLGSAYLPIDLDWSFDRVKKVLDKVRPRCLITDDPLRFEKCSSEMEVIDSNLFLTAATEIFSNRDSLTFVYSKPTQPAVLLVRKDDGDEQILHISHKIIMNRLKNHWRKLPFSRGEVGMCKSSLGRVESLVELFGFLLGGHAVFLPPSAMMINYSKLLDYLEEEKVCRIFTNASELGGIIRYMKEHQRTFHGHLKGILVSARAPLPVETALRMFDVFPKAKLVNIYSVTELAGDISWCIFDTKQDLIENLHLGIVPCGYPISNMKIKIDDGRLCNSPDGNFGEICVAGPFISIETSSLENSLFMTDEDGVVYLRTGDCGAMVTTDTGRILYVKSYKESGRRIKRLQVDSESQTPHSRLDVEIQTEEPPKKPQGIEMDSQTERLISIDQGTATDELQLQDDKVPESVEAPIWDDDEYTAADLDGSTKASGCQILMSNTLAGLCSTSNVSAEQSHTVLRGIFDELMTDMRPKELQFILKNKQDEVVGINMAYDPAEVSEHLTELLENTENPKTAIAMWVSFPVISSLPQDEPRAVLVSHLMSVSNGLPPDEQFELMCQMDEELERRALKHGFKFIVTKNYDSLSRKVCKARGYERWASYRLNQLSLPDELERPFKDLPDSEKLTIDVKTLA